MRSKVSWLLGPFAALAIGIVFAEPYARGVAPLYAAVAHTLAAGHPWEITSVEVQPGKSRLSAELQLRGEVRRESSDINAAARVIGRVDVGEVVETPVVFWTLLLLWPARSLRRRALRVLVGMPVFLGLEALTTATQLMLPLAQATALLAGERDPVTPWDEWSRFLEAGGQFVIVAGGAIVVAAVTSAQRADHPRD